MRPFGKKTIEFVTEERLMRAARFAVLFGLVLVAAASRLVPHPPNLTPIAAMALFGGAYFPDKRAAFLVPLAAMFLSDLVLGLHRGWPVVYGSFMRVHRFLAAPAADR